MIVFSAFFLDANGKYLDDTPLRPIESVVIKRYSKMKETALIVIEKFVFSMVTDVRTI